MKNIAQGIKSTIRRSAEKCPTEQAEFVQKYLGTKRKFICLKSADRDKILAQKTHELKTLEIKSVLRILDELFSTDTFEDFNFAGKLLTRLPNVREQLKMTQIKKWVSASNGWAECDCICQSLFDEKEVLARWKEFKEAIIKFSKGKNIQLRRASLVLQAKPNRHSSSPQLRRLAYDTIERLKSEQDVRITKAISWLLRELSRGNKEEVKVYLQKNKSSLPKIAYRETMKKIVIGKK